jgi:NADH-quinone oxidoreductase subunit K
VSLGLDSCLYLAAAVFSIGVWGVLARQNLIVILMSLELMLNAVNLALIAFGRAFLGRPPLTAEAVNTPQVFVLMVLAVAAAEAAVGLSILLAVYRRWRSTSAADIDSLKH